MDEDQRIRQFRNMTEADPENELGHFSLGKALLEAGQAGEAIVPLARALELNANLSKVYQFLGEAYEKAAQRDKAIEAMTRGVTVADRQGDRKPRDAMAQCLRGWDAPVPEFQQTQAATGDSAAGGSVDAGFRCSRCSCPNERLTKRPFKGALGEKVLARVCSRCWQEWIGMGTKVINELGLVLSSEAGQQAYDQSMVEFLQLEDT